jgi:hypothetical protein
LKDKKFKKGIIQKIMKTRDKGAKVNQKNTNTNRVKIIKIQIGLKL